MRHFPDDEEIMDDISELSTPIDPERIGEAARLLYSIEQSGNALALRPEACGSLAWLLNHARDMVENDGLPHGFHEAVPLMVDMILGHPQVTEAPE